MKAAQTLTVLAVLVLGSRAQPAASGSGSGSPVDDVYLPFILLNATTGVDTFYLPRNDDGVSSPIFSDVPIPFGNSIQHFAYVTSHGLISFGTPFYVPIPALFPGATSVISNSYLVAPFWSDIDIRMEGDIFYEVHVRGDIDRSNSFLDQVSDFVNDQTDHVGFQGTWMLVAQWDAVHPWPHGISDNLDLFNYYQSLYYYLYGIFIEFDDLQLTNTFQGIVVTDGESTYAVFTYQCGFMEWSTGGPVIGYNAAGDAFENHPSSGSLSIHNEVSCRDGAVTGDFRNEVYRISFDNITIPDPPPTVEPPQTVYLEFLEPADPETRANRTLPACDDCSLAVSIPLSPFGSYYHDTVYIGTNGVVSFGEEYSHFNAEPFPTELAASYYSYVVAPFWADADTRLEGAIYYETHLAGSSNVSDDRLNRVSTFIQVELGVSFTGTMMLLVTWDGVHPFPHGTGNTADPYLQSTNTFQTILITDGTKSYSIFTYRCDLMQWSDEGTIGFNAAGEFFMNHPLTGLPQANAIACVHQTVDSPWNNVIYDLVPDPDSLTNGTTPEPPSSIGTCSFANYTSCCTDGGCTGGPVEDCFCDDLCRFFGDCCEDIDVTCSRDIPAGNDTYLLFANQFFIRRVNPDGSNLVTVIDNLSGGAVGIDYHHRLGVMFFSDVVTEEIYQANLDGSGMTEFVNTSLEVVDDVAVDWINDKLYWTDTVHSRIEVADIFDTNMRKVLLRTGANTLPRAIVVDPRNRYMYWSDWGETAMIERASMDGQAREVIIPDNLIWPNGITIDYAEDKLYWADANLDKIEYSNLDGTNRQLLETQLNGVSHPFSVTIENELLYWTEWQNVSIFATHKTDGQDVLVITPGSLFIIPNGIEAVTPNRQPDVDNPCDGHGCSHFCLLSSESVLLYTCACPDGGFLDDDLVTCNFTGATPEPPEGAPGSCVDAGYDTCCTTGFCAGSPPSCLCDFNCHIRGDCCDDIDEVCPDNTAGSCAAAGFTDCCSAGDCSGSPATCFCDVICLIFGDCCDDFSDLCEVPTETPEPPTADFLPFLTLDVTEGVDTVFLAKQYLSTSTAISVSSPGFWFGNSLQQAVFVNSIGTFSFGDAYTTIFFANAFPDFPGLSSNVIDVFLAAPFWSDVDLRGDEGQVFYEVHVAGDTVTSDEYLADVSDFISSQQDVTFQGTWMLLAQWDTVHGWPYGVPGAFDYYGDIDDANTFQGLVITDGTESYALFTYQCDFVEWSRGATIGYNAGGDFFANHPLSTGFTDNAADVDCSNLPLTNYTNVIYRLSVDNPVTEPPPPTVEPPQTVYLEFLERTETSRINGTVDPCDDCSSPAIDISGMPFPLGQYQHLSFFVGTNGIVSFGTEFSHNDAAPFPTLVAESFYSYVAAPYWADADTRIEGEVYYEVHVSGDNPTSDALIGSVNDFLAVEEGLDFVGNWMLVVHWDGIHPFPHGLGFFAPETNTFQGVLISNGTKSYAVYIYMCGLMQWSDEGVAGWNAGGELYENHPLSGSPDANDIACVHQTQGSVWNNVIFDLVPGELLVGETTPEPLDTLSSCVAANYTSCCTEGACTGESLREDIASDCFCDETCYTFGDCCHDISQTCGPDDIPIGNDTYLIFTNDFFIRRISPDGSVLLTIAVGQSSGARAIEYHGSRGVMFWSDSIEDVIYQAGLNGTDIRVLLNESQEIVEDLATDWVNNKLYFTDSVHARIEVIDLDQPDQRVELLRTGGNTLPRSIAVDPRSRHMYWTDWGLVARIEQASMDGTGRTVIIDTDLNQPWGITIDYDENRLYWVDANLDKIEYSNFDGTNRVTLETGDDGVQSPFGITIENNILYWTETGNPSIFATHKVLGKNILTLTHPLITSPAGIEAVTPGRQPQGIVNPCDGHDCSDMCLLSSTVRRGYTCACPRGGEIMEDGRTCDFTNATPEPPVTPGSCVAAGFDGCCLAGFCSGSPPNCFCDFICNFFGDCCSDIAEICTEAPTPSVEPPVIDFIPFLELGVTDGVELLSLGPVDDDSQGPIPVPEPGFPFGNSIQTEAYVGSNGVISFGLPFFLNMPNNFPGSSADESTAYIVAPYWSDVDARVEGDIFYEVHEAGGTDNSDAYLSLVSDYIVRTNDVDFQGTWQLVVQWDDVFPWPHGKLGVDDIANNNTYQGIVITDGNSSFAVFTYRCDLLQWGGAVIGYNAAGDFFANHDFSGTSSQDIDCINVPSTDYNNVIYQLSILNITTPPPPPTIEPPQNFYLDFLERAEAAALNENKTLPACDDCSSPAYDISDVPFPLGQYLHRSFYVGTNGIVSMGREFPHHNAAPFPTELADTFYTYVAAPFWGDADTRRSGEVYYEVHATGNPTSDDLINRVNTFLQNEEGVTFTGNWMLVVHYDAVHPWPHGDPGTPNPILEATNTYQAVLITDGAKSYAVYIYRCGLMGWSDEATIGWNGGGDLYENHPLSGLPAANEIACVHQMDDSDLNNVIFDLVPGELFPNQVTPAPLDSTGSCVAAGYTRCCVGSDCAGSRGDCSCNQLCYALSSCCHDIAVTCPSQDYLPFLTLQTTDGVETVFLEKQYLSTSFHIPVPPPGFWFGNSLQQFVYVNSIGTFSFGADYTTIFFVNQFPDFPGLTSNVIDVFLAAPFWSDVDLRGDEGEVFYEVHVAGTTVNSDGYLANVSAFISNQQDVNFQGNWMVVAQWDTVHGWPYGIPGAFDYYGDIDDANTFQGLVITDGTESYAVFTYQCDFLEWSRGATIGYNAGGDFFANHPLSSGSTDNAADIDCSNTPLINWNNAIYRLSVDNPVTQPPPPTVEPPQTVYLQFLERTETFRINGTVDPCDDCSSPEIDISDTPFPLGQYQHFSFFVGTNGIISFGTEFSHFAAALFPTLVAQSFYAYVAAPYWADADTRLDGEIYYEVHVSGDNPTSDELIGRVNQFLADEEGLDFVGNWMLVVHFNDIHPFPHGLGFSAPETNTFQGVLISDGTKSYAVYIYMCGLMQWSDEGTIGWNAGGELYENHPLSGLLEANDIACVHQTQGSLWNNVIFDLVPGELLVGETTPEPLDSLASCVAANFTSCCTEGDCTGDPLREDLPRDCFCDELCYSFGDCCHDISQTCGRDEIPFGNDTYLIFTNNFFIRRINPDGSGLLTILAGLSGGARAIEYHSSREVMFWSDVFEDLIYQADLDGNNVRVLLNESQEFVEDLATDWVNNKLYFTDSVHARIEVIDLDQPDQRVELLRTGGNTLPRSIAVDPRSRHMYWTDWGLVPRIEQASMDGAARTVIIDTDLNQPWGITIDYDDNRLYWVDANLNKIEYSNFDGTNRVTLETGDDGVLSPFAITIENNLLFWTETGNRSIFTTHKLLGKDILALTSPLITAPGGIEAVTPGRQPQGIENPCDGNGCSHMCLLSSVTSEDFSCACPGGGEIMDDGITCDFTNATPEPNVTLGSCMDAGYDGCCLAGFCSGSPPNCFCDFICYFFGDCCSDIAEICTEAPTPSVEPPTVDFIPFLELGVTEGVELLSLGPVDDDSQGPIPIPEPGFPFGNSIQTEAYVGSNGVLSFGAPFFLAFANNFPGFFAVQSSGFIVAPYWDDVDARNDGDIFYEVHEAGDTTNSDAYLTEVSDYISRTNNVNFQGTWMLVAQWDRVHPWPHGQLGGVFNVDNFPDILDNNTYQGIVITDGNSSFAVFTYRCDLLQWGGAVIGYNAAGDFFANHDFNGATSENIDCINLPVSNYSNVIYQLSILDITITSPPPTVEPPQNFYLDFLERAEDAALNENKTLPACDDCSSPAYDISDVPFPLGQYLHRSFYVGNNGIVSMGREFPHHDSAPFPTELTDTFYTYVAAPFWADADTRRSGEVYYEVHATGNPTSENLINQVNTFLQNEEGVTFTGNWMLVVHYDAVHPWPHGKPGSPNPILEANNTYQAVLITDGAKSYAVYIYKCGLMGWSDDATIGWNAGGDLYENHPLSGLPAANEIACVHQMQGSDLNNVIFDLVPGELFVDRVTPAPLDSTGSCALAGYTLCCVGSNCTGSRDDCSCNQLCYDLSSCCHDIAVTCPNQAPGVVQNIATTAPSMDVLTIVWDPPADVFFTLVGYQVTVETISEVVYNQMVTATTTQVPNLARFIPYYINITVVTASIGRSNPGTAVNFTQEGTPTAAPSGVTVDRTSGTTMNVGWMPISLEEAQGFVAGYDFAYQSSNSRRRQAQTMRAPGDSSEFTITGLDPAAAYTVSVSAATGAGSGPSSPPVALPATCPFQIHFFGADKCEDLRSDPALNDIIQAVVDRTNSLCQCNLVKEQITNSFLTCDVDPNAITFRAAMLRNDNANCDDIVNRVEEWVTKPDTKLTVQGTELTTDTECPVSISSFDDSYCDVAASSASAMAARVAAPVVVILVVVGGVVIVIIVAVLLLMRRRKKATYEIFGAESEVGSINLTEAGAQYKPVGASVKPEKEGILAFEAGEDSGEAKGTNYQPVGGTSFQNPMYGVAVEQQQTEPEFEKVDLAAQKKAEADEEAEIEKMKMEAASYEVPGTVENPYDKDPVAVVMTKAQEAGYEELK